jgi:Outer membrane protein beta-barrel domain
MRHFLSYTISLLLVAIATPAFSQSEAPASPFKRFHYGALIGYGAVGLKTDALPTAYPAEFRGTFSGGMLAEYDFSPRYGIRLEALYENSGGMGRYQGADTPLSSRGIAIPLMVRIDLNRSFTYSIGVINSFSLQRTYFPTDLAGNTTSARETGSLHSFGIYSDLGLPLPSEHMEVLIRLGGDVSGRLRRTLFQCVWVVRI